MRCRRSIQCRVCNIMYVKEARPQSPSSSSYQPIPLPVKTAPLRTRAQMITKMSQIETRALRTATQRAVLKSLSSDLGRYCIICIGPDKIQHFHGNSSDRFPVVSYPKTTYRGWLALDLQRNLDHMKGLFAPNTSTSFKAQHESHVYTMNQCTI